MASAREHHDHPTSWATLDRRPLLLVDDDVDSDSSGSGSASSSRLSLKGFLEDDGEGGRKGPREEHHHGALRRYLSFGCAILSCLCAGSVTAFSLYGHLFLSELHYTQYEVNSVSIAAELAMYLPVPFVGYLCDRYNPGAISALASVLFGLGYLLAAFTYRAGPPLEAGGTGWPVAVMILAFVGVGSGTSSMYISAVTTCAKNFGSGRLRGLALALPIAAFGLSGMWQSQVGSRFVSNRDPHTGRDTLDVFKFFLFLSVLLFTVGIIGALGLHVVDEEILIDEAVEELERSGVLEDSALFRVGSAPQSYGTVPQDDSLDSEATTPILARAPSYGDGKVDDTRRKKTWLLNAETRIFLADHTMWWFAAGFFLVTGPGEAFINNLGTIIGTLTPPSTEQSVVPSTTAATHVSIVAISSTLARIFTGVLSDILAPVSLSRPFDHHNSFHKPSARSSLSSLLQHEASLKRRVHISRVTLLIVSGLLMSAGQVLLASGAIQTHADRFWIVSALIGTGYGAIFSLTPIICSVVWGVENFGTNWGIVAIVPAFGATAWGLVYSAVYQAGADHPLHHHHHHHHHHLVPSSFFPSSFFSSSSLFESSSSPLRSSSSDENPSTRTNGSTSSSLCFGKECYQVTFWAMAVSVWIACGMWLWAWRGMKGWTRRGIAI